MNNESVDAIFVFEYSSQGKGHRWSNLPDDLWWNLVSHLDLLDVDGVGFQDVSSPEELLTCDAIQPTPDLLFNAQYPPYHGDSSCEIGVFELTESVRGLLLAEPFDQWNRANDSLPFDELCLFQRDRIRIQAVPYENILLFYSLTRAEICRLVGVDPRFGYCLYSRDMQERIPVE